MMTRSVYQPTEWTVPIGRLIHHTSGWTLPLVMSLEGSHMTVLKWLVMAIITLTPGGKIGAL